MQGAALDDIPRCGGRFFWSQIVAAKRAGAEMLYVAMFDEVDEGTAIFKCTNDPPTANGAKFVTYEGLPSDHYLRLTGLAGPTTPRRPGCRCPRLRPLPSLRGYESAETRAFRGMASDLGA